MNVTGNSLDAERANDGHSYDERHARRVLLVTCMAAFPTSLAASRSLR
jgi:hypothetical protein